jgi:hypothetical protein
MGLYLLSVHVTRADRPDQKSLGTLSQREYEEDRSSCSRAPDCSKSLFARRVRNIGRDAKFVFKQRFDLFARHAVLLTLGDIPEIPIKTVEVHCQGSLIICICICKCNAQQFPSTPAGVDHHIALVGCPAPGNLSARHPFMLLERRSIDSMKGRAMNKPLLIGALAGETEAKGGADGSAFFASVSASAREPSDRFDKSEQDRRAQRENRGALQPERGAARKDAEARQHVEQDRDEARGLHEGFGCAAHIAPQRLVNVTQAQSYTLSPLPPLRRPRGFARMGVFDA